MDQMNRRETMEVNVLRYETEMIHKLRGNVAHGARRPNCNPHKKKKKRNSRCCSLCKGREQ